MEDIIVPFVKMMSVLEKKFPFPKEISPAAINNEMFDRPNRNLMTSVVYYLLNIINPVKCVQLVPHPLSVVQSAHFQRGVMKFLTETFNELPHVKIKGLRASTIATFSGERFIVFLASLATITIQLVYEKHGVVTVPSSSAGADSYSKLEIMDAKESSCTKDILQQRHPSAKKTSDVPRYEEGVSKLTTTAERLKAQYKEVVLTSPSPYREALERGDPVQAVSTIQTWKDDLKKSLNELARENQVSQDWSNAIREDDEATRASGGPIRLERDKLVNSKNESLLLKVAEDQNIQLFNGPLLSLSGFLNCTITISEKLNTLIMNSKFRESILFNSECDASLERITALNSEMNAMLVKIEEDIKEYRVKIEERQKTYDELVANGEITYRFAYSRPTQRTILKISTSNEAHDLPFSPGNTWKEEIECAKRMIRSGEQASLGNSTPKLSRKQVNNSSSISNLNRSVLQKPAWISSDSTVGEMFQGPLSSSSPVNTVGALANVATRRSLSCIVDDISVLDNEVEDFLANVSESSEFREETSLMLPDDTFGDFQPPEEQVPIERNIQPRGPVENVKSSLAPPMNPLPQPPSATPPRRLRPSMEVIVKRYTALKKKLNA